MSARPITLDTLGLAISELRQKGPHPNTANDLAIDVVPVVRAMAEALRDLIGWVPGPTHFHSDEAQQAVARARAAYAAYEAGQLTAPIKTGEPA